ncbi:MAG: radical SAM protein [Planctomycetota bacterium]
MELSTGRLGERAEAAGEVLASCKLCGHRCGVNRLAGERGRCDCGEAVEVAAALLHPGEEPCLSPDAGTIFFSRCNLACVYCQNWQISQCDRGDKITADELADAMLRLRDEGAANIELVSPTPWVPQIIDGLARAAERRLDLPVVYNTGGYDSPAALRLLDGVVDVYLPDMRYSAEGPAERLSGARDYPQVNRAAVLEMHRQVGDLVLNARGQARRGLIVRLLVLPNRLAGVRRTLRWIAEELSVETWFSLMAQYSPAYRASEHDDLNRPITDPEYDELIRFADAMGFLNFYTQKPASRTALRPDFEHDRPFDATQRKTPR